MFQLWFFHRTPPWEVNADGDTRYPEDIKAYLSMVRMYNEARNRELEAAKSDNKSKYPGPPGDGREVISRTPPPGFAKPGTDGEQQQQTPQQQRGVGQIKGPGVHIGRVHRFNRGKRRH